MATSAFAWSGAAGDGMVECPLAPSCPAAKPTSSKRRRVRATATTRQLWLRTRWSTSLAGELEKDEDGERTVALDDEMLRARVVDVLEADKPQLMKQFRLVMADVLQEQNFARAQDIEVFHE